MARLSTDNSVSLFWLNLVKQDEPNMIKASILHSGQNSIVIGNKKLNENVYIGYLKGIWPEETVSI